MVFLIRRHRTLVESNLFGFIKWPTVLVRKVNKHTKNAILRHVCVDGYILLLKHGTTSILYKGFQTLFMVQLDRSKATCPFKVQSYTHRQMLRPTVVFYMICCIQY